MRVLYGHPPADHIKQTVKKNIKRLNKIKSFCPSLTVIMVGQNPASKIYVRRKIAACQEAGIHCRLIQTLARISKKELKQKITACNQNPQVHAVLVQLPLPAHLPAQEVMSWIHPNKDTDGLTPHSQGQIEYKSPFVLPCTPAGIIRLLKYYKVPLAGRSAVVVGRSFLVGLPAARLLLKENATVAVCHSYTKNLSHYTQKADAAVIAAGVPGLLGKKHFKNKAVIIDAGIHKNKNKIIGDVRFDEFKSTNCSITPVPGGVGPMTVAMLLENVFNLALKASHLKPKL